jgi:hypothetical protein
MSGDVCNSKHIECDIQENGIIRRSSDGYIIGHLDCFLYNDLEEDNKVKVDVDLPQETIDFLNKVSKLSGKSVDDVVSMILSVYLIKEGYGD